MSQRTRSARGQLVDFNLLKIKDQIAAAPKPTTVAAREDFIDKKFKRRIKRVAQQVAATPVDDTPDKLDTETKEDISDDAQSD